MILLYPAWELYDFGGPCVALDREKRTRLKHQPGQRKKDPLEAGPFGSLLLDKGNQPLR
jgi:hypothetical protein